MIDMDTLYWAAREVERQEDTPIHVAHLVNALEYARGLAVAGWYAEEDPRFFLDEANLQALAYLVAPDKNHRGAWRTHDVTIRGTGTIVPPARVGDIQHRMDRFFSNLGYMNTDEMTRTFLDIHPFRDGNGRLGSILWNWDRLRDTPMNLMRCPDYYNPTHEAIYDGD